MPESKRVAYRHYLRITESLKLPVEGAELKWIILDPPRSVGSALRIIDDPIYGSCVAVVDRVEEVPAFNGPEPH